MYFNFKNYSVNYDENAHVFSCLYTPAGQTEEQDAVQVSGMEPVAEEELMKILDGEGLICCATHEPGKKIVEETAAELYWRRGFCSGSVCRSYCGNAGRRSRLPPGNHSP